LRRGEAYTMTPDAKILLAHLRESTLSGDTSKFIISLGRLLAHLDSSEAIDVALQAAQACLVIIKQDNPAALSADEFLNSIRSSSPDFKAVQTLFITKELESNPKQSFKFFVEALEHLFKAVSVESEGWRIHLARRAILYTLYSFFAEFQETNFSSEIRDENYMDKPEFVQYRMRVFEPIANDIERRIKKKE
jgi:hypothetical protein